MDAHMIPLLGAHLSIAGGLEQALIRGHRLGCTTIQIFTKSSNQWKEKILTDSEIARFCQEQERTGINPVISHASYLINLASPDDEVYRKSLEAMIHEVRRCEQLGIGLIVVHPGFHKGRGITWGMGRIADALDTVLAVTTGAQVRIALETTAGQGSAIGGNIDEIARIIEKVEEGSRLAFCLDTCHMFVAGYDLRTEQGYRGLLRNVERAIGLDNLRVIHLNDSKREVGSRVDRHENIGAGMIGEELFRLIMTDAPLASVPKIIETPDDIENLRLLRSFTNQT